MVKLFLDLQRKNTVLSYVEFLTFFCTAAACVKTNFFLAINMLNKVQSRQTAGISTLLRGVFKSTQDCFIDAA